MKSWHELARFAPTKSVLTTVDAKTSGVRVVFRRRLAQHRFLLGLALLYLLLNSTAVLTIGSYFAQTWDVVTFIDAAESFGDGGSFFDLYARSRANRQWPYAYPPLHALITWGVLVPGRWFARYLPSVVLPDVLLARLPVLLADIGVGLFLYAWFRRRQRPLLARAALTIWLFNPLLFYHTVAQGHFESEWLLLILAGYALGSRPGRPPSAKETAWIKRFGARSVQSSVVFYWIRGGLTGICFAAAILVKQVAVLPILAYGVWALLYRPADPSPPLAPAPENIDGDHQPSAVSARLLELGATALTTAMVAGAAVWPFLAFSADFQYMIFDYVADVPVQTQSAVVGFLFFTAHNTSTHTSSLPILQHQIPILLVGVTITSAWAARRGCDLWTVGALTLLLFVLFSKKVMGYYYVPLMAFLLLRCLSRGELRLYLYFFLAIAWISISPFYAPFSPEEHLIVYFLLGVPNTLLFLWLFTHLLRQAPVGWIDASRGRRNLRLLLHTILGLQSIAYLTAFAQPLSRFHVAEWTWAPVGAWQRPIAFELTAPVQELNALLAMGLLLVCTVAASVWFLPKIVSRVLAVPHQTTPRFAWGAMMLFFPLYFNLYYLTKESTATLEFLLQRF